MFLHSEKVLLLHRWMILVASPAVMRGVWRDCQEQEMRMLEKPILSAWARARKLVDRNANKGLNNWYIYHKIAVPGSLLLLLKQRNFGKGKSLRYHTCDL